MWNVIYDFFYNGIRNYYLMTPIFAWLVAQLMKLCTGRFHGKKKKMTEVLFGNGGMPSSHASAIIGLCIACLLGKGVDSTEVAISGAMSLLVITDAVGVRWETGKQAAILNKIIEKHYQDDEEIRQFHSREMIGHTPLQVFVGGVLGVVIAVVMFFIPFFVK